MARSTVLVVDDEAKIVEVVRAYLEAAGHAVFTAGSGGEALAAFERHRPDLVVLDLMLPDLSGEEVCGALRRRSRVPILLLTAKSADEEVIAGLGLGADEYVVKPFSVRQLVARVEALLRRAAADAVPLSRFLSFRDGELTVDPVAREVRRTGQPVLLTPSEYRILLALLKHPARTFTRDELIAAAFGDAYDGFDRAVDGHVKNLRQKIEPEPKAPRYILTVHGVGYRFGGAS